jgi:Ca2+:H+ antiporter
MGLLLDEIRHLLWLLVCVPPCSPPKNRTGSTLSLMSVLAIVPLARSSAMPQVGGGERATRSAACERHARKHDGVGDRAGHACRASHAGESSIAGAVVVKTLFGHVVGGRTTCRSSTASARLQAGLLFLATVALLVPSAIAETVSAPAPMVLQQLSLGLSVLLIMTYGLGLVFTLKTHRDVFGSVEHGEGDDAPWPLSLALATLAGVTVLVALFSEVFVESVQGAALALGMTPAFVGFIVVALVGGAAEMASAFSAARRNRLDLSVGIALGSASQVALFVAPVLVLLSYVIGPTPMTLQFWPGVVVMVFLATMTASLVTNSGRSAWFVGVLVLMVYLIFAMTLYLLPPGTQ